MATADGLVLSWTRTNPRTQQGVLHAEADGQTIQVDRLDLFKEVDRDRSVAGLGEKFPGLDPKEIRAKLLDLAGRTHQSPVGPATPARDFATQYRVVDGYLLFAPPNRVEEAVANFDAWIVEETIRDDGVEQQRRFVVRGRLASG